MSNVTPGFGEVLISSNTELRYENLIIGDENTVNNQTLFGTGIFRIDGFGALFNNNPFILPYGLDWTSFGSKRSTTVGYDMYVGKAGKGTLEISAGGRAEIQDAVLVGDETGAVGNIIVDGFDSFLGSGGFDATDTLTDFHEMILGRQGAGSMTVSGGATVDSEAPPFGGGGNQVGPVGAVLGSAPYTQNGNGGGSNSGNGLPQPGGLGTATVTGTASTWIVGGSLQIGGFDLGPEPSMNGGATPIGDPTGVNVQYGPQVGTGVLTVSDGGVINIRNAIGVDPMSQQPPDLRLLIGESSTVTLDGGTIQMGGVPNTGQQNQAAPDSIQLINDGIVTGSGRIDTGVFHNRYLGRVTVNAGQSLTITSTSQYPGPPGSVGPGQTPLDPLINYGLIEMIGTDQQRAELDFERNDPSGATPLKNINVNTTAGNGVFDGGLISGQWAILRSTSGIQNQGLMSFTAGTNLIQGNVNNVIGVGRIEVIGPSVIPTSPNTTLFVEGEYSGSAPVLSNGGFFQTLDRFTMTLVGNSQINLSVSNPNVIASSGDLGISGTIDLSLANDVLADLAANGPGQKYKIIDFGGNAYETMQNSNGLWVPDATKPIPDCTGMTLCQVPGLGVDDGGLDLASLLGPSFTDIVPVAQRLGQSIYISFLNPTTGGAMGPDFNGDGVVNNADLAIWKLNVGITSGATVLQGDANGDGKVDGQDFLIWQRNLGKSAPWSGASLAAVPEPTSFMMLLCGGSLAIAFGRRRFRR